MRILHLDSPVTSSSSSTLNMKYTLVLVRHGESVWNDENRFTGWYDSQLSDKGISEAYAGGKLLADAGFEFDVAYTSTLKRAIKTLWIILEEMDLMHLPIVSTMKYTMSIPTSLSVLLKGTTHSIHNHNYRLTVGD